LDTKSEFSQEAVFFILSNHGTKNIRININGKTTEAVAIKASARPLNLKLVNVAALTAIDPTASSGFGSPERQGWLPDLDARRTSYPQEVHLLVKMTIRRFKRGFIYLGNRPH
jgi:hypothetical protein